LAGTWDENLYNMNIAQISNSVIFIITITSLTGKELNKCSNLNVTCLPYYVIPMHYHIKLISSDNKKFDFTLLLNVENEYDFILLGESSITINVLLSTQYIKLHVLNLVINKRTLTLIKNNGVLYVAEKYTENFETNLLEFCFSNVLSPGLYTLKLKFLAHLTENSSKNFFKSFTNKENGIA